MIFNHCDEKFLVKCQEGSRVENSSTFTTFLRGHVFLTGM